MKRNRKISAWVFVVAGTLLLWAPVAQAASMAIQFDGADDHLRATAASPLKPTAQVAVEAWVKLTRTDSGGARVASMADRYYLEVSPAGRAVFGIMNGSSLQSVTATTGNVLDGSWHHLLGQKTATGLEVYVDGVLRGTLSTTNAITYPTGSTYLYVGRNAGGSVYDLPGTVDEIRIYNRPLSAAEIAAHYNNGAGQSGVAEAGLVGGWHLDEGTGTTTADYSGYGQITYLRYGPVWVAGHVGATPDTTAPTVSITSPTGGSTVSGTVTVTANASDNVGVAGVQFKLDGANLGAEDTTGPYSASWNTTTAANGSHTLTAVARDASGNTTTSAAVSVTVNNTTPDTTPPTGSITINNGAAATKTTAVTLTLSATDSGSGVAQMQFSNDGTTYPTEAAYATSGPWTLTSGDGTKTVYAKFKDAAGNLSAAVSDTITLDTTAPVISPVAASNITVSAATITWTTNEAATSQVQYGTTSSYGKSTAIDSTLVTSHSVALSGLNASTLYHYRARSKDALGNERVGTDAIFTTATPPDTTPPTGSMTINNGAAATNTRDVTLTLSATDNSGSVSQMRFSDDDASYSPAETYGTTKPWTLPAGDSAKTVYVQFKDAASNWSASVSSTITLDTVIPTITITSPKDGDVILVP